MPSPTSDLGSGKISSTRSSATAPDAKPVDNTLGKDAFLKLLEEPPADTTIIVTSSEPGALLPTIRSRVVAIRVPRDAVAHIDPELGDAVAHIDPELGDAALRMMERNMRVDLLDAEAVLS